MPVEEAVVILELLEAATDGGSPMTTTFTDVMGRPPASFTEWVGDHLGGSA